MGEFLAGSARRKLPATELTRRRKVEKKSTRKAIAERRARARRRKRLVYITIIAVLAVGTMFFFTIQNRKEVTPTYSEIDPNKSKGYPNAPVLVVEYGDFQ